MVELDGFMMRTDAKRVESVWHLQSEMPPPSPRQHARINVAELKEQIFKKIGPDRADKYFGHLTKLLNQKLTKVEFDQLCCLTIGRENIGLHNQFIRSILKNAYQANAPPLPRDASKSINGVRRKANSPSAETDEILPLPIWSNGDAFAVSPRRSRSGIRDRKARDRSSLLGPHGKPESSALQGVVKDEIAMKVSGNGNLKSPDLSRPLQLSSASGAAEPPEAGLNCGLMPCLKRPRLKITASPEQISEGGEVVIDVVNGVNGEPVEEVDDESTVWSDSPLRAPLGIPMCPGSVGSARKAPHSGSMSFVPPTLTNAQECLGSSELPDTETVHRRMEQVAAAEGLQEVSGNCANLLNHGLDAFLKRLIKSCIDLMGRRPGHEQEKQAPSRQTIPKFSQDINGVGRGHSLQMRNTCITNNGAQKESFHPPFSLLDFKLAMELYPQQLGEDWPLQLEKICFHILDQE